MSLAETCNQKKGWSQWHIKAPQLWRTVNKLENPPDIWDKLKDGADSVHLSELRYIGKSEPKMTWSSECWGNVCSNSPTLQHFGWKRMHSWASAALWCLVGVKPKRPFWSSGACSSNLKLHLSATVRASAQSCAPGLWWTARFQSGISSYKKLLWGTYFLLTLKRRPTWHHVPVLWEHVAHAQHVLLLHVVREGGLLKFHDVLCKLKRADAWRTNTERSTDSISFK